MSEPTAMIYVVDDHTSIREALRNLFASEGLTTTAFGSAKAFLAEARLDLPSCLVLDVRLPDVGGLEFQEELARMGIRIPIVFITAHGDVPMTARAMKAGAVEFLMKPFHRDELLAAVHEALERDRRARVTSAEFEHLRSRFAALSTREREVMALVTAGLPNKQIAARLALAEITVKVYRRRAMVKMGAASLPDLVRMAAQLDLRGSSPPP